MVLRVSDVDLFDIQPPSSPNLTDCRVIRVPHDVRMIPEVEHLLCQGIEGATGLDRSGNFPTRCTTFLPQLERKGTDRKERRELRRMGTLVRNSSGTVHQKTIDSNRLYQQEVGCINLHDKLRLNGELLGKSPVGPSDCTSTLNIRCDDQSFADKRVRV